MAEKKTTWTLSYGIHNGKFTSRDSDTVPGLASEQACRDKIRELERLYAPDYVIWFADAYGPNGEKVTVHGGSTNYNNNKTFAEMRQEQGARHRQGSYGRDPRDPYDKKGRSGKDRRKKRSWW